MRKSFPKACRLVSSSSSALESLSWSIFAEVLAASGWLGGAGSQPGNDGVSGGPSVRLPLAILLPTQYSFLNIGRVNRALIKGRCTLAAIIKCHRGLTMFAFIGPLFPSLKFHYVIRHCMNRFTTKCTLVHDFHRAFSTLTRNKISQHQDMLKHLSMPQHAFRRLSSNLTNGISCQKVSIIVYNKIVILNPPKGHQIICNSSLDATPPCAKISHLPPPINPLLPIAVQIPFNAG